LPASCGCGARTVKQRRNAAVLKAALGPCGLARREGRHDPVFRHRRIADQGGSCRGGWCGDQFSGLSAVSCRTGNPCSRCGKVCRCCRVVRLPFAGAVELSGFQVTGERMLLFRFPLFFQAFPVFALGCRCAQQAYRNFAFLAEPLRSRCNPLKTKGPPAVPQRAAPLSQPCKAQCTTASCGRSRRVAAIRSPMISPSAPAPILTVVPSSTSPDRIISASGSCSDRWITRFSGRAP